MRLLAREFSWLSKQAARRLATVTMGFWLLFLLTLPSLEDEDRLLAQARRGSRAAVETIYETYFDAVYQFIRWRVDDPLVAEDLTSDVFIRFLNALQSPNAPRQSLRGWLFRVARNVLYDHAHQPVRTTELDDLLPAPPDMDTEVQVLRALDAEQVRAALQGLAPDQQEVLVLRFGQMMSLQETAESMGRSVSAIKSLQFRAVNTLRRELGSVG
ncbi:MAG: sigma-70 family RNA polymerase sigma factor [Anaerolineae bacterium]|nr:sigma-70 family RNA polymerase sigma factor [Anaerolineae bacterium]